MDSDFSLMNHSVINMGGINPDRLPTMILPTGYSRVIYLLPVICSYTYLFGGIDTVYLFSLCMYYMILYNKMYVLNSHSYVTFLLFSLSVCKCHDFFSYVG